MSKVAIHLQISRVLLILVAISILRRLHINDPLYLNKDIPACIIIRYWEMGSIKCFYKGIWKPFLEMSTKVPIQCHIFASPFLWDLYKSKYCV